MISMEFLVATGIGVVTACGIYLLLRGRSFTVVLGLSLLGYAVNVFIFAMGRLWQAAPPVLGQGTPIADPLPQALVPLGHSFLVVSRRVARMVERFLRSGRFA